MQLTYTERTWGIELISEINDWCKLRIGGAISRASGEAGIKREGVPGALFPDVCLFTKDDRVLMGWELKFPDTPVDDVSTIENAIEKADRLGTNSFLVWNVNQANLHLRAGDSWRIARNWPIGVPLRRADVGPAKPEWRRLLRTILEEIEALHANRAVRDADVSVNLGRPTYRSILEECAPGQAKLLCEQAVLDQKFEAKIQSWARESIASEHKDRYRSLAEAQIINWINKVLFSHYLKRTSEDAYLIDAFDSNWSASQLLDLFDDVSSSSDFRSIFAPVLGQEFATGSLMAALAALNGLLRGLTAGVGGDFRLEESLAGGMAYLRGKVSGQFSTPTMLAKLLVGLTVTNLRGSVIDPCSGSGTIAKAVIDRKRSVGISTSEAARTVWASDKFNVPVGFTGIALANPEALGSVQQVFQKDVAHLAPGMEVDFVEPTAGGTVTKALPKFDAVVSNLPFVRFESIASSQSRADLVSFAGSKATELTGKSDLYAYIALGLKGLCSPNGRIGLIMSNSWLGTEWGEKFLDVLRSEYHIEILLTSGIGKWFDNADVIATIVVLTLSKGSKTAVVKLQAPIADWDEIFLNDVMNALFTGAQYPALQVAHVPQSSLGEYGVYPPNLAYVASFIDSQSAECSLLSEYFDINRGSRPNAEGYYFIEKDSDLARKIEPEHLRPLLHKPGVAFRGKALGEGIEENYYLVSINASREQLLEKGHVGALAWIESFAQGVNKKGVPFPEVLKTNKPYWYVPRMAPMSNLLMQLNPEQVLAVYRPKHESLAVSQRFFSLNFKEIDPDIDLIHALLNSSYFYFWQEALAFPKGLGAVDRNPTRMKKFLRFPDPRRINPSGRDRILKAFAPLSERVPMDILDELQMQDRIHFDEVVCREARLSTSSDVVRAALAAMVRSRLSVKD